MRRFGTWIAVAAVSALTRTAGAQPGQTEAMPLPTWDDTAPQPAPGPQPAPAPDLGPDPAPQPAQPPPGSTQATFVSSSVEPWDVLLDRVPVCATPCSLWVEPLRFVSLRTQERAPIRLDVGYLQPGSVVVTARPHAQGKYAAGVVFTTFSGMGLITGITLTAIGCTTDRSGMCTAGLITGGVSAVGLYASILLMKSALPAAHVGPAAPYATGNSVGLAGTF